MSTLNLLQDDYAVLTEMLQPRRNLSVETMKEGAPIAWQMYLAILADALHILNSLIDHLKPNAKEAEQISS